MTALGRIFVAGNNGTHLVKIVLAGNLVDVPGAAVNINMLGGTPGEFKYAVLPSAVTLAANTMFYVVSQETSGGDQWHDFTTVVTTTTVATEDAAVYMGSGFPWTVVGGPGQSYVPVDFKYLSAQGPASPTVAITNPTEGATFTAPTNILIEASASAGVVLVEFFANSIKIGEDTNSPFSTIWTNPAPGNYSLTAKATDTNGMMNVSSAVNITVGTNGASTAFILTKTLGTLRNNFGGHVGMKITVSANPISVTHLARICAPGNSGIHEVVLVRASDLVEIASVLINLAGCPSGEFVYGQLATPVVLDANTMYYVASVETAGGDSWYDVNTAVTSTGVATVNSGIYEGSGYALDRGGAGKPQLRAYRLQV